MGYLITYDGVPSTDLTGFICHEIERQLIAEPRSEHEYVGGMPGALFFEEAPGLRRISIPSSILVPAVNAPARRAAVREVAAWYNQRTPKKLILGDEPTMMEWAVPAAAPSLKEWRQRGEFTLEFLCDAYSYDVDVTETAVTTAATEEVVNVTNDGDVPTPMIVEITAGGGALASQAVSANGRTWTRAEALGAGEAMHFNGVSGTIHTGTVYDTDLAGLFEIATLSMENASGRPPYLLNPGVNAVTINTGVSGVGVRILHRNRYS